MKIIILLSLILWCYSVFYVADAIASAFSDEIKTTTKKFFNK